MNIPQGFDKLVNQVLKESTQSTRVPKSLDIVWRNLTWCSFLNDMRTDAENNYAVYVLSDILDRTNAKKKDWVNLAKQKISNERNKLNQTNPGYSLKIKTLNSLPKSELKEIEMTLKGADRFFDDYPLTYSFLEKIKKDKNETKNLIAEISYYTDTNPNKIYGMGYTKTTIWLWSCGLASDFCPPNNHTVKFLRDNCGSTVINLDDFYVANNEVEKLRNQLQPKLIRTATVKEIGHAIWLYKTTQHLLSHKPSKNIYTPHSLMEFLNDKNWNLDDMGKLLGDIERYEELKEMLIKFMK